MLTNYKLNAKDARNVGNGSYISQSGAYLGTIRQAWVYDTKNGATMLDLTFETTENAIANINMCIFDRTQKPTFQKNILDALMTVFRIKEIQPVQSKIRNRKGEEDTGYIIPEFQRKPIGMLLQLAPEEFIASDNSIKIANRINLLTPFDAQSKRNAKEILDNEDAQAVERALKTLKDRPLRKLETSRDYGGTQDGTNGNGSVRQPQASQAQGQYPGNQPQQSARSSFDTEEDLPF